MNSQLPPRVLVKTWLEIIKDNEIPPFAIQQRTKIIIDYFGSIELAYMYIEHNKSEYKKAC